MLLHICQLELLSTLLQLVLLKMGFSGWLSVCHAFHFDV